jgi:hypothetical protein
MKIFIGSSSEGSEIMKKISDWLKECGHDPLRWNEAICPGQGNLINQLIRISREVDGAIFIFTEDDPSKDEDEGKLQPRDNVIFEYGLFMGTLGAERVVFVRVGKAKIATDLNGIVYIDLPKHSEEESEKNARTITKLWVARLTPVFLKSLGIDLVMHIVKIIAEREPVANILCEVAPRLVAGNASNEIRALCSDKGKYNKVYYRPQFSWVAKKSERSIRRIFVRSRGDDYGFSDGETLAINMHLDEAPNGVAIRWIFADSQWLIAPYSSSLGFAIFGKSWLVHWGLESGVFHDRTRGQNLSDYGVFELLDNRFEYLWKHSEGFCVSLIKKIRQNCREVAS